MSVAKLYPYREGKNLMARGVIGLDGVSKFFPIRMGPALMMRGRCNEGVVYGFPYRDGSNLMFRTRVCNEDLVWCCRRQLPENLCVLIPRSECKAWNEAPYASEQSCLEDCIGVVGCPAPYDFWEASVHGLAGTISGQNYWNGIECVPNCTMVMPSELSVSPDLFWNFNSGCASNWVAPATVSVSVNFAVHPVSGNCYVWSSMFLPMFNSALFQDAVEYKQDKALTGYISHTQPIDGYIPGSGEIPVGATLVTGNWPLYVPMKMTRSTGPGLLVTYGDAPLQYECIFDSLPKNCNGAFRRIEYHDFPSPDAVYLEVNNIP